MRHPTTNRTSCRLIQRPHRDWNRPVGLKLASYGYTNLSSREQKMYFKTCTENYNDLNRPLNDLERLHAYLKRTHMDLNRSLGPETAYQTNIKRWPNLKRWPNHASPMLVRPPTYLNWYYRVLNRHLSDLNKRLSDQIIKLQQVSYRNKSVFFGP